MNKVVPIALALAALLLWWWLAGPSTPNRQRPAAVVNVELPRLAQLNAEIDAVGTVQARASILLTSEVDGRLTNLYVDEGQSVKKGQKLASFDDRIARAQLMRADAQLKDAQAAWDRAQLLREKDAQLLSPAEAETLEANVLSARADREAAAASVADHTIVAPFAGVIGLRRVNVGSYVRAGDVLSTLDDLDNLEVLFSIPERHLGVIATGQIVIVGSSSYPEREFSARVTQLDTRVDAVNRTVSVKASLDNAQRLLRPGQFLTVQLQTGSRDALMIPEQAIITEGSASYVYAVAENFAQRVEVKTGSRKRGWVEIISGLVAEQPVVINGHSRLGAGAPVEIRDDAEALMPSTADAFNGS